MKAEVTVILTQAVTPTALLMKGGGVQGELFPAAVDPDEALAAFAGYTSLDDELAGDRRATTTSRAARPATRS